VGGLVVGVGQVPLEPRAGETDSRPFNTKPPSGTGTVPLPSFGIKELGSPYRFQSVVDLQSITPDAPIGAGIGKPKS
jgi:hypothetical protein